MAISKIINKYCLIKAFTCITKNSILIKYTNYGIDHTGSTAWKKEKEK